MIRRGKQAGQSCVEDLTPSDDNLVTAELENQGTPPYLSNSSNTSYILPKGQSGWKQGLLHEIEAKEGTDTSYLRRKTVSFDPYSSEDLDIFNDYIEEGPGNFVKSVQILSSTTSSDGKYSNMQAKLQRGIDNEDKSSSFILGPAQIIQVGTLSTQRKSKKSKNQY